MLIVHSSGHLTNTVTLSLITCRFQTETALPGILNETCVKPKEESTIVIFIRNILEEENTKMRIEFLHTTV